MSAPNLHQLALLEGTPASVAEAQTRFGINLEGVASLLVAIGYHDAKRACMSQDPEDRAKGHLQMRALADASIGLSDYYEVLGQIIPAAQAAEIAGTAFGFANERHMEAQIASEWCERLTGEANFEGAVKKMATLEGDEWLIATKFVAKMAKYTPGISFEERCGLVSLMATRKHPDTLGRALWACEAAPSSEEELVFLNELNANLEVLNEAKPEQRERFQARIAEIEGTAPKP